MAFVGADRDASRPQWGPDGSYNWAVLDQVGAERRTFVFPTASQWSTLSGFLPAPGLDP